VSEETPRCSSPHKTSRYLVARIERTPSIEMLLHTRVARDARSGSIKRVASAVGEGAMAVRLAYEHLQSVGGISARS
jgi:hypothetical protein